MLLERRCHKWARRLAVAGRRLNCDRRFHETLPPIWGLHEFAVASGNAAAADAAARAAQRGAELLLDHRLFRALATGEPIHRDWLTFHWPPYWHYDVLQALVVIGRLGLAGDPRAADALDLVRSRRKADGRWRASARWWNPPGSRYSAEAVDWTAGEAADRLVTARALTVLRAADAG